MKTYKMADRVKDRKGEKVVLPPIEESVKNRVAYLRLLRAMLRELGQMGRKAKDSFDFELLASTAARLALTAEGAVNRILRLEAQRHTATFMQTAKKALGINLADVVLEEDLTDYLRAAGMRNAGLIKGLGADAVKRVQETVSTALISGTSSRELQARLTEQLRISDRRAQLIAQDQLSKLNADLNRIRHEQAGVTEYQWATSRDERVRERHRALEGKVYKYGERTGAEDGLPPGQPIRCRCVARGIVDFGDGPVKPKEVRKPPPLPQAQQEALDRSLRRRRWTAPIERE